MGDLVPKRDSMGVVPAPEGRARPPAWFVSAMHDGIIALCRLPLGKRPKPHLAPEHDEQLQMAEAFAEVAWQGRVWEPSDAIRIEIAFQVVAGGHRRYGTHTVDEFPNVHDLLDAVPRKQSEVDEERNRVLTPEEKAKAEEARQRLLHIHARRDAQAAVSRTEQITTINAVLRRHSIPVFRTEVEISKHQRRQEVAGELIAKVNLG